MAGTEAKEIPATCVVILAGCLFLFRKFSGWMTRLHLRAVHTLNFPELVRQLGASLLVTTYQAGKLVLVREETDHLNTHFRGFQAPMGMALAGDRLAVGTTIQVWQFVNVPAVVAMLDPPGRHDACFLPVPATSRAISRSMRWPGMPVEHLDVNTRCSCLCTLDESA